MKRTLVAVALTGAGLVFGGASQVMAADPGPGGIIQGLGLIGANGQNNEDSSKNNNVISGGDQQLSGQNITNNPEATVGDTVNDFGITG